MPLLEEFQHRFHRREELARRSKSRRDLLALGPHVAHSIRVRAAKLESLLVASGGCATDPHFLQFLHPLLGRPSKRLQEARLAGLAGSTDGGGPLRPPACAK